MPEMYSARANAQRRSIPWWAVASTALVFAVACNDDDAVHGAEAGAAGAASAGASSHAGAANHAGASGAGVGGNDAGAPGDTAGAGGAPAGDAGAGGESEAGAAGEPGQATTCAPGGTLFVVGNYADAAGNRVLLRSGAKAVTFALVPSGVASPAQPPRLFLVDRVCAPGGALLASDESSTYRVDFVQTGNQFRICFSTPVATLAAAALLSPADSGHLDTGCAGKPFAAYNAEAL